MVFSIGKLGHKISKGVRNLGHKASNTVNQLGKKAHNVLDTVDKKVSGVVNKAENIADKAIKASGGVTNALKVGTKYLDKGVSALNKTGALSAVPIVGQYSDVIAKTVHNARVGAKKLDQTRDKYADKYEDMKEKFHVEKQNVRKRIEDQINNAHEKASSFF